MPTTYATEELKAMCESPSGIVPDRRNLVYHVTCPVTQEPCIQEECEYRQCVESWDSETESEIYITIYPHPGVPHIPHTLNTYQDCMLALTEAMMMLDKPAIPAIMKHVQSVDYSPVQRESLQFVADGVTATLNNSQDLETSKCSTCQREHISTNDNCFRCERTFRHPAL